VFLSTLATLSFFPLLAFMYGTSLVFARGALLNIRFLPYSIVSMATLSAALTVALCLAFAFSASVSLLLGK
jgi:hypothetical protein